MAQVFADSGCLDFLRRSLNNTAPTGGRNLTLRLFANNVTPASDSTASTFTEAAGGGYAAITLTDGSWTVSTADGIAQAVYAARTWTLTGALTTNPGIFGYYITNADGTLVTAERLAAAGSTAWFTPASNGDNCTVTPKIQMSHGTPTA